jgi:hypothetical protein
MSVDFATFPTSQLVWMAILVVAVIIVIVVLRFFWRHVIRYLLHGCLTLLAILVIVATLHYLFKLF